MIGLDQLGPVTRRRRPLAHTRAALGRNSLTVGFLGGSITAPQTGTRWPEPLARWFTTTFSEVTFTFVNAALGATGSDLAVFRVQPEIIARGCDLVFVEYAVNDFDQPTARRQRTREGLLRQLAAAPCDVVLVYTFRAEMLSDLDAGRVPATIAEFETLADHYGCTSIWVGLHALREVRAGLMTMDEWLPDGLHPEVRGSRSYAESVIAALTEEFHWERWRPRPLDTKSKTNAVAEDSPAFAQPLGDKRLHRRKLSSVLHPGAWGRVSLIPLAAAQLRGAWTLGPWSTCPGLTTALHTTATDAGLRLAFTGRGLVLGFDFGQASGEVRFRIDRGPWQVTQRERPAWLGDSGWLRPTCVADDLRVGRHELELETLPAPAANGGGRTTLGLFGLIH